MIIFKNKNFIFILSLLFITYSCDKPKIIHNDNGVVVDFSKTDNFPKGIKTSINVLSPTIIKITTGKTDSILNIPSLIVNEFVKKPVDFNIKETSQYLEVSTDSLIVKLNLANGAINFTDKNKTVLLTESGKEISPFKNQIVGQQNSIKQNFSFSKNEVLYGLGQQNKNTLNIRGQKFILDQQNTKISVPVILSTKGYGLYWDNYSRSTFDDTSDTTYIASEIGDKIQYYFIKGTRLDHVISGLRDLTGTAPMVPKWALGYVQSRNRYKNREILMDVVKKQRELNIPLDVIILDYLHWGDSGFGSMIFDPVDFPNPEEMIQELHDKYHCKIITSVWPSLKKNIPNWKLFKKDDLLLDLDLGVFGQVHDAFNPEAGQLYYDLVKKSYIDKGIDGIWFDATEPEKLEKFEKTQCYLGPTAKFLNLFSYFDMKNVYERQRETAKNRIVNLTRSGFLGQQKFGSILWSGDIGIDFKTLKEQIPTGLNLCMTGIPYWNTDIGGYLGGDPNDPKYQEVFTRWFQYGTFTPFFRAHGRREPIKTRDGENELWSYGTKNQEILKKYVNLRYQLLPYIYTISHKVSTEGYTMMRALAFDFMDDKNVHEINDQFMFGNCIMVCPVLEENATKRSIYLPKGSKWYNFWTNEVYEGGQTIETECPIETIPLFIKGGSILPMGEIMQYANEKPNTEIELKIYPDTDATFLLYEDENDNYNYLDGKFTQIPISYSKQDQTLKIGPTKGEFDNMLTKRNFNVTIIGKQNGDKITIPYNGTEINYKL
ncbi:TIM-barrel domain-containing protein [Flavivirga abyssicola]|uniref:glycoside hydrolase family 31 protein n=1 Tax=Flavivirga abyssicola TaxID=3063533 RepID=UPI0026DEB80D|nr:TIM-barrel domain-containing protein [Flavivirga sp. MEBiC07777]WVK11950.1 TIM-barrel domain-containing protein [Flavivirga sp. MEBiC07777]